MTALVSVIPILLLIILMMGFKVSGYKSAIITLVVTIILALFAAPAMGIIPEKYAGLSIYGITLWSVIEGFLKACFPIILIIICAIYSYNILCETKEIETITFYNHEAVGEKITRRLMTRLKFSNDMIDDVCHLVKEHMFHYEASWSDAAVRRFIMRVSPENLENLYDLRLADMYGMYNEPVDIRYSASVALLLELKERVQAELEKKTALSLKSLASGRLSNPASPGS